MTVKEACDITLEVWNYFVEHPECYSKDDLPPELYAKIEHLCNECSLCDFYYDYNNRCPRCPLGVAGEGCTISTSAYGCWQRSEYGDKSTRKEAAETIVRIVSEWKLRGYR
jgi:hypothetical protein